MTYRRLRAEMDHDFVVFLIGMRINRWWRPDLWIPVALAMARMLEELEENPELGFLGATSGGLGNPSVMVQYWRSRDHLMRYARSKDGAHLPAWVDFKRRIADTDACGIWHETFPVEASAFESVYGNMPAFGLGKVGRLVPAGGHGPTGAATPADHDDGAALVRPRHVSDDHTGC